MLYGSSIGSCLPVLSILAIMAWSYYAYVVELCMNTIEEIYPIKVPLYLLVYHLLCFMFAWTYFKVMCAGIAVVPVEYKVPEILYERIKLADTEAAKNDILLQFCYKKQLVVITRNEEGYIRFCKKCKQVKPDRTHHCSTCKTCILKMDHHCPWINNCIGFSNYKYFVLFLCYASLYCMYYAGTTLEYFIKFWEEPLKKYSSLHVAIGFIVSLGLGVLVVSFCCYHMSLISKNQTTLEILQEPTFRDHNRNLTFHIGVRQNFAEVFGDKCFLWFLPVWSSYGDGLHYPVRLMF